MDVDGPLLQIHLRPSEPGYLMRADTGIEHQSHRWGTAAAMIGAGGVLQVLNLLWCQNCYLLFSYAWGFYLSHGIAVAPAPLYRCAEYTT